MYDCHVPWHGPQETLHDWNNTVGNKMFHLLKFLAPGMYSVAQQWDLKWCSDDSHFPGDVVIGAGDRWHVRDSYDDQNRPPLVILMKRWRFWDWGHVISNFNNWDITYLDDPDSDERGMSSDDSNDNLTLWWSGVYHNIDVLMMSARFGYWSFRYCLCLSINNLLIHDISSSSDGSWDVMDNTNDARPITDSRNGLVVQNKVFEILMNICTLLILLCWHATSMILMAWFSTLRARRGQLSASSRNDRDLFSSLGADSVPTGEWQRWQGTVVLSERGLCCQWDCPLLLIEQCCQKDDSVTLSTYVLSWRGRRCQLKSVFEEEEYVVRRRTLVLGGV